MVAARNGAPNLQPQSDGLLPADILTPGGKSGVGVGTGLVATITPGVPGTSGTTGDSRERELQGRAKARRVTVQPALQQRASRLRMQAHRQATGLTVPRATMWRKLPLRRKVPVGNACEGRCDLRQGQKSTSDATGAGASTQRRQRMRRKLGDSQNSGDPKKESSSKKKKGIAQAGALVVMF